MKEMAKMDLEENLPKKEEMDEEIKVLLIPKDPADAKNAVMEIRAGTGGDEASIFAGDLYRMYTAFAQSKGWKTELVDIADGTSGGYKEIIFNITGENVYGQLKFESQECIGCKECHKQKHKVECTLQLLLLLYCLRRRNLI